MVEWKELGKVCSKVFAGGTPSTKHEDYYDGDIPWIRSGEIDFNIIKSAERYITEAGYKNSSAKLIRKNSVVMAMTGATVAKSAVVEIETSANQSVCALETNETIANYKFVYYVLANNYFNIKSMAQGALTSLNLAMIKSIQIPIPSIEEQNRIVGILDTLTFNIDNLKNQIKQRQKQYEFYREQLLDLEGKEGVEWKKLGEVCLLQNGFAFKSISFRETGSAIIRITNISANKVNLDDCKYFDYTDYEHINLLPFQIHKGDILIAMSGATTGKVGVYEDKTVAYLNQRVGKFIPNLEIIRTSFLYHWLLRNEHDIYIMAGGGAQPNLSSTKFLHDFTIPIPSLSEQQRIVSILDTFEKSIKNLESQLTEREKQYEYYRNQLLTFE